MKQRKADIDEMPMRFVRLVCAGIVNKEIAIDKKETERFAMDAM